ncbi:MAG: type IX secretion system membrane protein PorP/SprF [Chlorobi bacterium]|nr:type IX secretion system membrane protein PorP/SprF [Chlorobiota bacterium]
MNRDKNNIMKHILLILSLVIFWSNGNYAQQLPIFSQFMLNDYALNPAIGGIHNYYQVKTTYRLQWVGIDDAPSTYMISTYGPHRTKDMGFGGYMYSDQAGPTSNLGIYFSYSYNFQILNDIRLSLGLFGGTVQWKYDANSVKMNDGTDPLNQPLKKFHPDASFGAYVYTAQWDVGFSANQLFMTRLDDKDSLDVVSRLTSHFYLTGRYRYTLNRDIDLEGSMWLKYVAHITPQVDFAVRGIYQKMAWFGISYRSMDAVSILLGYNQGVVNIGFSYDITTSAIRSYSSGTVEVIIGVRFANIKSSRGGRRSIR